LAVLKEKLTEGRVEESTTEGGERVKRTTCSVKNFGEVASEKIGLARLAPADYPGSKVMLVPDGRFDRELSKRGRRIDGIMWKEKKKTMGLTRQLVLVLTLESGGGTGLG